MAGEEVARPSELPENTCGASMRPRLGGRGRVEVGSLRAGNRRRFNEAPARWPGKSSAGPPGAPGRRQRFNEAPARWPGKRLVFQGAFDGDPIASMRPRLGGRGRDRMSFSMATSAVSLQ